MIHFTCRNGQLKIQVIVTGRLTPWGTTTVRGIYPLMPIKEPS